MKSTVTGTCVPRLMLLAVVVSDEVVESAESNLRISHELLLVVVPMDHITSTRTHWLIGTEPVCLAKSVVPLPRRTDRRREVSMYSTAGVLETPVQNMHKSAALGEAVM
ncbi:hypothetical protein [Microbispora sp. ATCC PTA-5024]|uniref:hypothetical protein n=1 Tax=Microbispora sp. ATCC PTA-5024 TaxID=316330 RepID=UPI0003DC9A10|nr:hypothetical protein [Microbispora sp. ATCC PTA-5024]ETK36142.1 hypothetical protein MPTA5024_10985 [Microbispora sp. ATCC PTA-5024]